MKRVLYKMPMYINTSEIASFIGQNKWDYHTSFEKMWKRYDYDGYMKIINDKRDQLNEESKQGKDVEHIKNELDFIYNSQLNQVEKIEKELGNAIVSFINKKELDTNNKRIIVNNAINDLNINQSDKYELLNETESFINKTHGIIKEDSAIDMFEKKFNVLLDTTQEYHTKLLIENVYVGGKLDGICESEKYIVEVKNRTRGFFNSLRDYENTQIQIYMYIMNYNNAKLVEMFDNKIKITNINRDDKYIKKILNGLKIFIKNFNKFINDEPAKHKYILSTVYEKKGFLQDLYIKEINTTNIRKPQEINLIDDLD